MPRRAVALTVGVLAGALVPGAWAIAGDQTAPSPLKVRSGSQVARGTFTESLWTTRSRGVCVGQDLVGSGRFPHAIRVKPGHRARIHLPTRYRPIGVILYGWRHLDSEGRPVGDGHRISNQIVPVRPDGTIESWKVRLRPKFADHLYIVLFAAWQGECHANNWTQWRFHLRAP